METEEQNGAGERQEVQDQGPQQEVPPAAPQQHAAPPEASPPAKKEIVLPSDAIAKIRQEEREKGRKAALAQLDEQARKLGYRNHEAMVRALQKQRQQRQQQPARTTQKVAQPDEVDEELEVLRKKHPGIFRRYEEQLERMKEDKRRINRARAQSERQVKALQKQLEAQQAEAALRLAAVKAGVQDVDYALHLLRKELRGKGPEELAKFDESKWFSEDLRKLAPYVFGTRTEPATTGPSATQQAPKPPPPEQAAKANGSAQLVDVMKMSRQEYLDYLRKKGLSDPASGF